MRMRAVVKTSDLSTRCRRWHCTMSGVRIMSGVRGRGLQEAEFWTE